MRGLTPEIALERMIALLPLLVVALLGTVILEIVVYFLLTRVVKTRYALPYTLVAPAVVALALFTVYPFVYNIQLAFSDLRLKTLSCYVPNNDITNAPCSLGQAALNAEVEIFLDEIQVRAEPSEAAEVAFTLQRGDVVFVSGTSKPLGYVADTGFATSEEGTVCNPLDRACVERQREAAAALETQDERDWWQIERDGDVGWIPNITFYMEDSGDLYAESLGTGELVGSVEDGEEVRMVTRTGETWYRVRSLDGDEGWTFIEPRQFELFLPAEELSIYQAQDTSSEVVGTLGAEEAANLLRNQPLVWYEVALPEGNGWINSELSVTELYQAAEDVDVMLFDAPSFDPLTEENAEESATEGEDSASSDSDEGLALGENQNARIISTTDETWYLITLPSGEQGYVSMEPTTVDAFAMPEDSEVLSAPEGEDAQVLGELSAGEIVAILGSTTLDEDVWQNIQSNSGLTGWVPVQPEEITEVTILPEALSLLSDLRSSVVSNTLPAGTQVLGTDISEDTLTWYELSLEDGTVAYTNIPPDSTPELYATMEETPVYASFGDTSELLTTLPDDSDLDVMNITEQAWYQLQTRGEERLVGWVNAEPRETQSIFSLTDDATLYSDFTRRSEAVAELSSGATVEPLDEETRYWYQVRKEDGTVGWVNAQPEQTVTTTRDIVLYSLEYGWENFKRVFVDTDPVTGEIRGWGRLLQTENSTFPRLMRTTLLWTFLNVTFHLIFGMTLALMLNKEGLRFKGLYRAIIILPWAIPQVIIALAWRGEFNFQFGFVNALLQDLGMEPVQWLLSPTPAFIAVTFVNIWLGIPFYMVTLLGGLQSISGDYYEAASMDGASAVQKFWNITVPLIRPVAVPIVTLDVIWTFNNFNVIYLITRGGPNESTNILVTALYNAAFGANGQFQLGFAAAFSLVIFLVLLLFASVWVTQSGALKGIYEK